MSQPTSMIAIDPTGSVEYEKYLMNKCKFGIFDPVDNIERKDKVIPIHPNPIDNVMTNPLLKTGAFVRLYHLNVIITQMKAKTTAAKAVPPFIKVLS